MTDQIWKLCAVCEGDGVVKIPGGVSVCDHCQGTCYEPTRRTDNPLQQLVAAVDRYMAAKGRDDAEWLESFNGLMNALQAAKQALGVCRHGTQLGMCTDEACYLEERRRG